MDRKVGEVFEVNGRKLKVVKVNVSCDGCYFINRDCLVARIVTGNCLSVWRSDKEDVIFKEVKND